MEHVGGRPAELRRLVTASRAVFDALAGEDQNISDVGGPAARRAARLRDAR